MKVNAKKASKTKGKVTTKDVKPGTQTITSMFKRQIASTNTNCKLTMFKSLLIFNVHVLFVTLIYFLLFSSVTSYLFAVDF